MNDRSLILKIIQHPLIREAMENELATSSIITKLIAEELTKEKVIREFDQNKNYLEDLIKVLKNYEDIYNQINEEIKKQGDKLLQDIDTLKTLADMLMGIKESTQKQDKFVKQFFKSKEWQKAADQVILGITKSIKQLNTFIKFPEKNAKSILDSLKTFLKFYEYGVSVVKFSKDPDEHECILLLRRIIKMTGQDTGKNQSEFAKESQAFIKIAQFKTDIPGNVKNKISKAHEVYAKSLQSNPDIERFVELATKDDKCKTQFQALKEKSPEEFVIGSFLILYKTFLERIGRPTDEKADKMLDAMKRTNKLATEQKDIYWSLDGGFTQVFEVAYLPAGSETANNGTQEKPLSDYNISQENLKTGKKGSILIVRSEQLYKVEKIVQEQEEGKRITVSLPIDNVKQYNALFSGTEDEKGMPTGPGAFFVHSDQEKMVPLKKPEPEIKPETEPEQIDLEEGAIKNYLDAFELFKTKFLNVKKLHTQSEIFRQFYMTIFPIAGINPDTIVGQQMDAYTQVARPDQKITADDVKIDKNLNEEEKEDKKNLTKNISQNAKVIERHANAILEILEEYQRYLNIDNEQRGGKTGGIEQGSRVLFDKFGESDPKKLIRKFVKLIIKDINASIKSCKEMIELSKKQLEPQDDKKEKEQEEPQELNEAAVDNSVRELPVRDKIILVIKTAKQVIKIGEKLKEMIARTSTPDEVKAEKEATAKATADKAAKEGEPTKPDTDKPAGKRDDLLEAETAASDARKNANPTGTASGARELRKLKARGSDEISLGYKEEANKIYELLTKIRPLFPTSQPFDTNYSFDVAMESFKSALTGLSTNVAQVSGYEYDQLTDEPVLSSFVKKLEGFKEVIKDIFGYTQEAQDAENQASFNEEGENSGLPHPEPAEPTEGDTEEDSEALEKFYTDESEFYKRMKTRASQLAAGESAEDFGFVPLQEETKSPKQLIEDLKKVKALIEQAEEEYDKKQRTAGTQEIKKAKETLQAAITKYISMYEEIGKIVTGKDPGSNIVRPDTKVKRIDTLVKSSVKFLEDHKTTYEFFMGLIMDTPEDPKSSSYINGIWKRMTRLDGQAVAITDARMKQAIRRAKINIEKIFDNRFPKANFNFSSFKTFVTRVADKVSDIAIKIDNSLKEEEGQQKEFDLYNKQVVKVFNMMKEFIGFYKALELAVQHLRKKDFAQTVFIKSFDREYETIVNLSRKSRFKLRAISTSFRGKKPSMVDAKKYGFPPEKTTSEPSADDAEATINSALKKTFKLEKLQQESGMSDSQINLYARLLVALDEDGIVELVEAKPGKAFVMNIKKIIKAKFNPEEQKQILKIISLKGVLEHLQAVYVGDAVEVEGDVDDILDIPEPDQEKIVDIINSDVGEMDNSQDFWNKPLEDQVDLVLKMPKLKPFVVKYLDAKPFEKNEEEYQELLDKTEDEENKETTEKVEYDNLPDIIKPETPGESEYDRIMNSKVPESLGYSAFPEEEEVLKLFKWYQATKKSITEAPKEGQLISNRISDKHPKLDKMISDFVDELLQQHYPEKVEIWSKIMERTGAMNKTQSAAFLNYLLHPIGSKHSPAQKKEKTSKKVNKTKSPSQADMQQSYYQQDRLYREQLLANKLKPLIREMLNKGK